MTTRRFSVLDAAEHLSVSVNAVRMRIRRGTLASEKDEEGNVWVIVGDYSTNDSETTRQTNEPTSGQIEDLREQLAYLREIIATRDEELRRKDHIIMQMAQRIPELEAPSNYGDGQYNGDESHEEPPQREERQADSAREEFRDQRDNYNNLTRLIVAIIVALLTALGLLQYSGLSEQQTTGMGSLLIFGISVLLLIPFGLCLVAIAVLAVFSEYFDNRHFVMGARGILLLLLLFVLAILYALLDSGLMILTSMSLGQWLIDLDLHLMLVSIAAAFAIAGGIVWGLSFLRAVWRRRNSSDNKLKAAKLHSEASYDAESSQEPSQSHGHQEEDDVYTKTTAGPHSGSEEQPAPKR